jgi:hypothetical protein
VYYKNKKDLRGLFNHSLQFLMFIGSGIYQPPKPPPQPPQPQQLKQPQQPPKPPKPPKPLPHANAWWVAARGPAANSNTAAAIAMKLNTRLIFVSIVI